MSLLVLVRKVIAVVESAAELPDDWSDEAQVTAWLQGMAPALAGLIVLLAAARKDETLKRLASLNAVELQSVVVEEAETAALTLSPDLIAGIVQILLFILRVLQ